MRTRMRIRVYSKFVLLAFGVASLLMVGCASTPTTITTVPSGAFVEIDGANLGTAPINQTFNFDKKKVAVVSASLPGYFKEELQLNEELLDQKNGVIKLVLEPDEAWKVTTTSDATNKWLRVQVASSVPKPSAWQKLVDSVTGRYSSLEQLDDNSGYLRSVYIVRKFKGPKGSTMQVRTRFLGSIASDEPLVYKMKIESEYSDKSGDWVPYDRVFKEDASLVEELQDRLGFKS